MEEEPESFTMTGSEEEQVQVSADEITEALLEGRRIDIRYGIVDGNLRFSDQVRRPVRIRYSKIKGHVSFQNADFDGGVSFGGTSFRSGMNLSGAHFRKSANFIGSVISRDAKFNKATFHGNVSFDKATFDESADFRSASFCAKARFCGTEFGRGADFGGASFDGTVDFDLSKFSRNLRLNQAALPARCFDGIGQAYRRCSVYGGAYFFKEAGLAHLDSAHPSYSRASSSFRDAKVEYEKEGRYDRAAEMFVEEKDSARLHLKAQKGTRIGRFGLCIWKYTSNYGESPWRFIGWLAVIVLVFALIYMPIVPTLFPRWPSWLSVTFKEYPFHPWGGDVMGVIKGALLNFVTALYFSMVTFATLGFGDITPTNSVGRLCAIAEVLLGYLMFGVLITLVARKMTRS